ncbi:MAG: hypothetical protein U9N55_09235 [candidate division Zixibacteria bacterium]|nr:hypothetical protein [candidate division Zixibacteria bacterium]
MNTDSNEETSAELVEQVDSLTEEVKVLALNLAIYLAKAKQKSDRLSQLEPDFIRLVNGTVKTVQELTSVISASRDSDKAKTNQYKIASGGPDPLEAKLRNILDQCVRITTALSLKDKLKQ